MNSLQDRAYAVAIFVILGICCIGAYVAVSGFMSANPEGLQVGLASETGTPTPGVTIQIPTDLPAPPTNIPPPPTLTPVGFRQTDPPAATRGPTLDFLPTIATPEFTPTPSPTATPQGCNSGYCPHLGPPDARGPKGATCSQEYIWGFVTDRNGVGIPNVRIHFRELNGGEGDARTKGDPDPPGRFDFPAATGTWTVSVWSREGDPVSQAIQVQGGVPWDGVGNCPTRIDFIQS